MRKLLPVLLATLVLGPVAQADDKHHPPQGAKPAAKATAGDQRFAVAYDQMKKMMAQMDRIKATRDPKERERLMQQHLDSMHEGAQALRPTGGGMMKMMDCQMMGGPGKSSAPACPMMDGAHGRQGPAERMDMMEKRIDMMQMMMEQMIEREAQHPAPKQE